MKSAGREETALFTGTDGGFEQLWVVFFCNQRAARGHVTDPYIIDWVIRMLDPSVEPWYLGYAARPVKKILCRKWSA
jgi:hypothetical protein